MSGPSLPRTGPAGRDVARASGPAIVWLRDELRVADNPALAAGVQYGAAHGVGVVVLFVHDEASPEVRPLGGASKWWLHHSLAALDAELARRGGRLSVRLGAADAVLAEVVAETGAGAVFWNRRYGAARELDARIKAELRGRGVSVASFSASLLVEPWELTTGAGEPYRVFSPFWRAVQAAPIRELVPTPSRLDSGGVSPAVESVPLDALGLLPSRPDWAGGLRESWQPGEAGAWERLRSYAADGLDRYDRRDEPAVDATSRLSAPLRFGEISAVQLWWALRGGGEHGAGQHGAEQPGGALPALSPAARIRVPAFLREVAWRDFCRIQLFVQPALAERAWRPEWEGFGWLAGHAPEVAAEVEAWRRGRTGVPLVDAGMRELWRTGTMHNRVRMVAASYLVKHLLVDWRVGERWFWDTLVDADEGSNPANWQWVAGSGADAAPYFRIFNPETQAAKFDPDGAYVRRWVPELGTPAYPAEPIVGLAEGRDRALAAYAAFRDATADSPAPSKS